MLGIDLLVFLCAKNGRQILRHAVFFQQLPRALSEQASLKATTNSWERVLDRSGRRIEGWTGLRAVFPLLALRSVKRVKERARTWDMSGEAVSRYFCGRPQNKRLATSPLPYGVRVRSTDFRAKQETARSLELGEIWKAGIPWPGSRRKRNALFFPTTTCFTRMLPSPRVRTHLSLSFWDSRASFLTGLPRLCYQIVEKLLQKLPKDGYNFPLQSKVFLSKGI